MTTARSCLPTRARRSRGARRCGFACLRAVWQRGVPMTAAGGCRRCRRCRRCCRIASSQACPKPGSVGRGVSLSLSSRAGQREGGRFKHAHLTRRPHARERTAAAGRRAALRLLLPGPGTSRGLLRPPGRRGLLCRRQARRKDARLLRQQLPLQLQLLLDPHTHCGRPRARIRQRVQQRPALVVARAAAAAAAAAGPPAAGAGTHVLVGALRGRLRATRPRVLLLLSLVAATGGLAVVAVLLLAALFQHPGPQLWLWPRLQPPPPPPLLRLLLLLLLLCCRPLLQALTPLQRRRRSRAQRDVRALGC